MGELINGIYYEKSLIGQGAFGQIYLGENTQTKELVAIKKEMANTKNPQLVYEAKVYKCLEGGMGIPKVHLQKDVMNMNVMVMDLLGPSLEDMFNYCYRRFSVKTVLMLGIELLTRLEFIHHRNFIHRDIKPDNFVLGLGARANVVYVIDFGLSKRYRTPGTKEHIPYPSPSTEHVDTTKARVSRERRATPRSTTTWASSRVDATTWSPSATC